MFSNSFYIAAHEQVKAMRNMVRQGLEEGAFGIVVGYPQRYETFEDMSGPLG